VIARTRHYDGSFVSDDPDFGHAHVTALGPFAPDPAPATLEVVGAIAADTPPLAVRFERIAQFPDGIIHLVPEPDTGLRGLSSSLVRAFPEHPPYGGRYGTEPVPHLTLDAASPEVSVDSTRRLLGGLVPFGCVLDELQLAWWESGRCHVMQRWALRGTGG
jgi:hypothetical protein